MAHDLGARRECAIMAGGGEWCRVGPEAAERVGAEVARLRPSGEGAAHAHRATLVGVGRERTTSAHLVRVRVRVRAKARARARVRARVRVTLPVLTEAHGTMHVLSAPHTSPLVHMPSVHGPPEHMPRVRVSTSMDSSCGGS